MRSKPEKHLSVVMEKSSHQEHLFQPLQTRKRQLNLAVSFSTSYNGIFYVTKN